MVTVIVWDYFIYKDGHWLIHLSDEVSGKIILARTEVWVYQTILAPLPSLQIWYSDIPQCSLQFLEEIDIIDEYLQKKRINYLKMVIRVIRKEMKEPGARGNWNFIIDLRSKDESIVDACSNSLDDTLPISQHLQKKLLNLCFLWWVIIAQLYFQHDKQRNHKQFVSCP